MFEHHPLTRSQPYWTSLIVIFFQQETDVEISCLEVFLVCLKTLVGTRRKAIISRNEL